jgi:hypothetical protein
MLYTDNEKQAAPPEASLAIMAANGVAMKGFVNRLYTAEDE